MTKHIVLAALLSLATVTPTPGQTPTTPNPKAAATPAHNEEMKQIFLHDQYDRGNNPYAKADEPQPKALPGIEIRRNDDAREIRVKELLQQGLLHTGTDYYRAALVFQHSGNADGTLLAHVLAEIALSKGEPSGLWLSAATLDRYLVQIKQKQIFGTQFKSLDRSDQTKPYLYVPNDFAPNFISDPVRAEFCVKPAAIKDEGISASEIDSGLTPCPAFDEMQKRSSH